MEQVHCITYHHPPSNPTNPTTRSSANRWYTVLGNLTCKQEDGEVSFLLDRTTPVPGACQSTVNATASVVEVIRSRTIKSVPEEVREDFLDETIDGTELLFDKSVNAWAILQGGDLTEGGGDREEDAVDLGVLVDEHQGVRNVVVTFEWSDKTRVGTKEVQLTHMDNRGADPCADALLSTAENGMHHPRRLWSGLYTVQTLAGIAQPVW